MAADIDPWHLNVEGLAGGNALRQKSINSTLEGSLTIKQP